MIWVFILAAIAFVLGGVLAVKPSKAQQQVAAIRANAIQSGIHVKLPVSLKFPDDIEKGRYPFYCRQLENSTLPGEYYCARRDGNRIAVSSGDIPVSLKAKIDQVLMSAHSDIYGFYFGDGLIGFSWLESDKKEIFAELCERIEKVKKFLQEQAAAKKNS